jgi:hypothetical protein
MPSLVSPLARNKEGGESSIVFICAVGLVALRCVYVICDLYYVACYPSLTDVMYLFVRWGWWPFVVMCDCAAAPLGDFCTELSFSKDCVSRTCCARPAAPLGDFCTVVF